MVLAPELLDVLERSRDLLESFRMLYEESDQSGAQPIDHNPSIDRRKSPTQKNAAFLSNTCKASWSPNLSR
jgi:hypothetical protein